MTSSHVDRKVNACFLRKITPSTDWCWYVAAWFVNWNVILTSKIYWQIGWNKSNVPFLCGSFFPLQSKKQYESSWNMKCFGKYCSVEVFETESQSKIGPFVLICCRKTRCGSKQTQKRSNSLNCFMPSTCKLPKYVICPLSIRL